MAAAAVTVRYVLAAVADVSPEACVMYVDAAVDDVNPAARVM